MKCILSYTQKLHIHTDPCWNWLQTVQVQKIFCHPSSSHIIWRGKSKSSPSWWCQPTIWSSVAPLLLLPSIFPSIRGFSNKLALCIWWPKFQCFRLSISPSNDIQGCFPLGLTDLILQSEGLSRAFSSTIQKHQFFSTHFKAQFQFLMSSRAWVDKCFL